jgi:hypothetical protein
MKQVAVDVEALATPLAPERERAQAGGSDAYVFEALALRYAARGDDNRAAHDRALHARE